MSDPRRKQIREAFQSLLETVTNMFGEVWVMRPLPAEYQKNLITIFYGDQEINSVNTFSDHKLVFEVEAIAAVGRGSSSADVADSMLADIFEAVGSDPSLGGCCLHLIPKGIQPPRCETRGVEVCVVSVKFLAQYRSRKYVV